MKHTLISIEVVIPPELPSLWLEQETENEFFLIILSLLREGESDLVLVTRVKDLRVRVILLI